MCRYYRTKTGRRVVSKQDFSPEEVQAFEWLLEEYQGALGPVENDIEAWLAGASDEDLASLDSIRSQITSESDMDGAQASFKTVFREGSEQGAHAGRAIAARRFDLDVVFDVVPESTLEVFDEWSETAADSTLETITEDTTRWIRGAHKKGLDVDDIADQINDELFESRLEDHVAERAARTATISSSNAGNHSAMQDAPGVVGEEWVATLDSRVRNSHENAHGQIVAVDTTFEVGGSYLDYPGDPSGPLDEIVNCRCTATPVFPDDLSETELEVLEDGERLKATEAGLEKLASGGGTSPIAA